MFQYCYCHRGLHCAILSSEDKPFTARNMVLKICCILLNVPIVPLDARIIGQITFDPFETDVPISPVYAVRH